MHTFIIDCLATDPEEFVEVVSRTATTSQLQFAAFLWYNNERNLDCINDFEEIKKLQKRYKMCSGTAKKIYEGHTFWKSHRNRQACDKTKKQYANIKKAYLALADLTLAQRTEFESDMKIVMNTLPKEK